jgi:hypothetical protein
VHNCTVPGVVSDLLRLVGLNTSAAEEISRLVPDAAVVEAFNRSNASHFWNRPFPTIDDKSRQAGIDPKLVADQVDHRLGVSLDVYIQELDKTPRIRRRPKSLSHPAGDFL